MKETSIAEDLIREAWEYWGRSEPVPAELRERIDAVPKEALKAAWEEMYKDAENE